MEKFAYIGSILCLVAVALLTDLFTAQQADWKRGRVYHRLVCTSCHVELTGKSISPMDKTIEEWANYYEAGRHGTTAAINDLDYYLSDEYRESIRDYNLAAEKYIDVPSAQLAADIQAFALRGARDSDTPMRCQ